MHKVWGLNLRVFVYLPDRSTVPLLLDIVGDMVSGILKHGERGVVELTKPLKLLTLDFSGIHHDGLVFLPGV
jgi:hypothetical protein